MASPTTFPYGPGQTPDNITSLPAGQAKVLGSIGAAGIPWFDYTVAPLQFTVPAGAAGEIDILIACSEDGSHWTDGISATATTDQSSLISSQMTMVRAIPVQAAGIYRAQSFGIYNALGGTQPMFWTLLVWNKLNVALGATASGHLCQYSTLAFATPVPIAYV